MYVVAALAVLGALAVIATDDYPEIVQAIILGSGLTSSFLCACWGDYIRLQLAMYELKFTETDLAVRNYKAGIAKPTPVKGTSQIKGIKPTSGHRQRNATRERG
jgi:hypothetical protein